jgi:ketosteroid isomerase-like protein
VSVDDVELARKFLDVLADAARTGDRHAVYCLLTPDVEWSTPQRDVHGIDAARAELTWIKPPAHLDVEFDEPDLDDLGEGRIVSAVRETYTVKGSGDFAYARDRRIDLTIRDGKVVRYEMRVVG